MATASTTQPTQAIREALLARVHPRTARQSRQDTDSLETLRSVTHHRQAHPDASVADAIEAVIGAAIERLGATRSEVFDPARMDAARLLLGLEHGVGSFGELRSALRACEVLPHVAREPAQASVRREQERVACLVGKSLGDRARLALEAGEPFWVAFERRGKNLHGYITIQS